MRQDFTDHDIEGGLPLVAIIRILWTRKIVLVLITAVGCAIGLWIAKNQPLQFIAQGILLVQPQPILPESSTERIPPEWDVATERDAITSRAMLSAALDRIDIPQQLTGLEATGTIQEFWGYIAPNENDASEADRIRAAQIETILDGLVVEANERSLALSVLLTSSSAAFAADFVNALLETYLERRVDRMAVMKAAMLMSLGQRRDSLQERIDAQADEMKNLLAQPDAEFALQRARDRMEELESISERLALDSEQMHLVVDDSGTSIAARAVTPLRPSRSNTVFILAAAGLLSGGLAAIAFIIGVQRSTRGARSQTA